MRFANKSPESKVFVISTNFCADNSSYKSFLIMKSGSVFYPLFFFFFFLMKKKFGWTLFLTTLSFSPLFMSGLMFNCLANDIAHIPLMCKCFWSRSIGVNECSNSSLKSIMNDDSLLKLYYRTQILDKVYLADNLFQMQKLLVWK